MGQEGRQVRTRYRAVLIAKCVFPLEDDSSPGQPLIGPKLQAIRSYEAFQRQI